MLRNGIDWPVAIWLGTIHVGALAAPFFFSWPALVATVVLHWMTGGLGVCLGYHRLLTHQSFKTQRWVRYVLSIIGGLSGEGSAICWTANHRKHHAHSDHVGDPHSPLDGPWWSHILWTMARRTPAELEQLNARWIPDLKDDKDLLQLHRYFLASHFALGVVLGVGGYLAGGWYLATSMIVWGMFLRLALVLHSTWFVNSASHIWGYRNYETTDESRNNWWVAIITYGEGWHNNHHAYPRMARHGHRWWEVDVTFLTIRLMEKLGLAWDVVDHQHKKRAEQNTVQAAVVTKHDVDSILKSHRQPKNDSQHLAP